MLKPMLTALTLTLALAAPSVHAQTTQQNRMADCNKQAEGKKGDDRKAFMKSCLSGKPQEAAKPATPQQRMKDCNQKATGLKGDERKAFMSKCLKG